VIITRGAGSRRVTPNGLDRSGPLMSPWSLGRLSVVGKDPATGQLMAAANPRGIQGYVVGR